MFYCSMMLLLLIEYCWNVYPATFVSSLLLHLSHFVILVRLLNVKDKKSKKNTLISDPVLKDKSN